jgi:nitrogen-specific signal transduction histidine kinase
MDRDVLVRSIRLAVERRRAEQALRTASRLDVTATLVGGIAHQFNNLLCSVIGNAELLKLQLDDQPAALGNLAAVLEAAKKASELARQLHGLAHSAGGERQEVSLSAAIEQALQLGAAGRNHTVEIVRELEPNLWTVRARPDQMIHLAVNLCRNAVEAVEGAGRVSISTGNVMLDEATASRVGLAPGPYVTLRVADTGRGMDPETMSHVFEPFFTTKPRGKGLGMPAVQEIVAEYEGGIAVDSEPGRGTRVEVYLPASEASVPANYQPAEAKADTGARTVLVIDDEEMILRLTRRLLEGLGHTVLTAPSGAEAVEIASSRPGPIDIALLDLNLPGVDSAALYQSLMDARPQMKVIICSGELGSSAEPLLRAGAASFLSKPFRLDALEREVGRVV